MKIEFGDKRLALIWTERAHELGLPFSVIKSCRDKLAFIGAAPDERTLRNWKSLRYKKLAGTKMKNDQFALMISTGSFLSSTLMSIHQYSQYSKLEIPTKGGNYGR
ncbi:hypothetical protein [Caulobacter sp. B11]|uniref:hypothetical protein n=1 Tax=Caulobacter sp. B11 TaxID=2048899 RepID=UPI000C12DE0C|nr:hypothetical protein [Caulobacter sp. B11]